jgi:hypothetical protein
MAKVGKELIPDRDLVDVVPQILKAVAEAGGDRWQWCCATAPDAEEAIARHRARIRGTPLIWRFASSSSAHRVLSALAEAGLQTGMPIDSRGGPELYCCRMDWQTIDVNLSVW